MATPYCGVNEPPKKHRRGTVQECLEKGQIRYYGIQKVSKDDVKKTAEKKADPVTRTKLLLLLSKQKGLISRNKGRYEGAKDNDKKAEYYKIWQEAEAARVKISAKLKKLDEQRKKEKEKEKEAEKGKKSSKKKKSKTK